MPRFDSRLIPREALSAIPPSHSNVIAKLDERLDIAALRRFDTCEQLHLQEILKIFQPSRSLDTLIPPDVVNLAPQRGRQPRIKAFLEKTREFLPDARPLRFRRSNQTPLETCRNASEQRLDGLFEFINHDINLSYLARPQIPV